PGICGWIEMLLEGLCFCLYHLLSAFIIVAFLEGHTFVVGVVIAREAAYWRHRTNIKHLQALPYKRIRFRPILLQFRQKIQISPGNVFHVSIQSEIIVPTEISWFVAKLENSAVQSVYY